MGIDIGARKEFWQCTRQMVVLHIETGATCRRSTVGSRVGFALEMLNSRGSWGTQVEMLDK